jgi:peroxiredoxin Q/BCP
LLLTAAAASGVLACSQPQAEGSTTPAAPAATATTEPAPAATSATAGPAATQPAADSVSGGLLAVGAPAPDVTGKDAKGQVSHLSDRKGHVSIVYFYPKDGTPGCTKEACAFRDTFDKFSQRGITIFGVSRDDEASHAKFLAEHSLQFPLVSDPSGTVQKAYGVPDKAPGLASRVTFLVAADGSIAKVWPDVDPAVHADEVWKAIEQLN